VPALRPIDDPCWALARENRLIPIRITKIIVVNRDITNQLLYDILKLCHKAYLGKMLLSFPKKHCKYNINRRISFRLKTAR
jgi:hypothetical protein